jgi:rhodanese-related sulfurtransferase
MGVRDRWMDGKVEGISPEETHKLVSSGKAVLLDVRSKDDGASDVQWMNNKGGSWMPTTRNHQASATITVHCGNGVAPKCSCAAAKRSTAHLA